MEREKSASLGTPGKEVFMYDRVAAFRNHFFVFTAEFAEGTRVLVRLGALPLIFAAIRPKAFLHMLGQEGTAAREDMEMKWF